jgi:hypothetical protein
MAGIARHALTGCFNTACIARCAVPLVRKRLTILRDVPNFCCCIPLNVISLALVYLFLLVFFITRRSMYSHFLYSDRPMLSNVLAFASVALSTAARHTRIYHTRILRTRLL